MINALLWAASWFIPSDEEQPMGPVTVMCALEEGAEVDVQTQYHPSDIGIHFVEQ